MVGLLGKKVGMTHIFMDDGSLAPVTVIQAGPCRVVQKKEQARDGYESIQIGYSPVKESKVTKALLGHMKKSGGTMKHLREIRTSPGESYEVGQELKVDLFAPGDLVNVTGVTKGKGFAGGVKRHGYRGGAATHGSMFHRAPGSIGASSYPSRVGKGKKMPGHMGHERKTLKNLKVLRVDKANNLLLVQGAVPGSADGLVLVIGKRSPGAGSKQ